MIDREPIARRHPIAWIGDNDPWVLVLAAILYVPLAFLGPGSIFIAYRVLRSGLDLVHQGVYAPSRYPGYFVHEAASGLLYSMGGAWLPNLATVLFSLAAIWAFLYICRHHEIENRHLLSLVLALHPLYWIASTSTYDFVWAIALLLLAYVALVRGRWIVAGVLLGLAVGTRLGSIVFPFALLVAGLLLRRRPARAYVIMLGVGAVVGAGLYVPSFASAGYTLDFLTYSKEAWSTWAYAARFVYKNIYFWGLPGAIVLVLMIPVSRRSITALPRTRIRFGNMDELSLVTALTVGGVEVLFLGVPQSPYYILPVLPFGLLLLGKLVRPGRGWLIALLVAVGSFNLVNVDIAQPDVPHHATTAELGVWIERGPLLEDLELRQEVRTRVLREGTLFHDPEVERPSPAEP